MPGAARVAVLVNPANATRAESTLRDVEAAARAMGLQIHVLNASTSREIDAAFATLVRERCRRPLRRPPTPSSTPDVSNLPSWRRAMRCPRSIADRDYADAGGLMSYGSNVSDAFRQVGVYAGRILKGDKPADLPVVQPTKFELVINLQTAKALGLDVPPTLLARADEVIE